MEKREKSKEKMQNSLMEKWTEIEKINKGCFSSSKDMGKDMLFTQSIEMLKLDNFCYRL